MSGSSTVEGSLFILKGSLIYPRSLLFRRDLSMGCTMPIGSNWQHDKKHGMLDFRILQDKFMDKSLPCSVAQCPYFNSHLHQSCMYFSLGASFLGHPRTLGDVRITFSYMEGFIYRLHTLHVQYTFIVTYIVVVT